MRSFAPPKPITDPRSLLLVSEVGIPEIDKAQVRFAPGFGWVPDGLVSIPPSELLLGDVPPASLEELWSTLRWWKVWDSPEILGWRWK